MGPRQNILINDGVICKTESINEKLLLGDTILQRVQLYNYLGVIIDDTVTFVNFLKEKCRKVNERK